MGEALQSAAGGRAERPEPIFCQPNLLMTDTRLLVLGTHNPKKRLELEQLLEPYGFQLRTLDDFPEAVEVDETGETFAENAALKATVQARHLKHWVLGEDSGLSVRALGDAPGVYSARFSGPGATDESNNRLLLEKMANVADDCRDAYYVSHVALSNPDGQVVARCEDRCRGRILRQPAGSGGFGYDPLFQIPEYHRTFGELDPAVKAVLSHRGRAMRRFVPLLLELTRNGQWPPDNA